MNSFEYKENTYAQHIIKNGFSENKLPFELKVLAKYYKAKGLKPKQREKNLYQFCKENIPGYDEVLYYKMIDSALNYATKKQHLLMEIDYINVTKAELAYLNQLEISYEEKKVLFSLIVLNKLQKEYQRQCFPEKVNNEHYYGGSQFHYRKLKNTAKIPVTRRKGTKTIHQIIKELADKKIVEIKGKGYIKLSFIYEIKKNSQATLPVHTYDNIGYYYDYYNEDKKIKVCHGCETLIKLTSNRMKYCQLCAAVVRRKQNKEKALTYYYNRKMETIIKN